MILRCGFNWRFPNNRWYGASSHVFIWHLWILCVEQMTFSVCSDLLPFGNLGCLFARCVWVALWVFWTQVCHQMCELQIRFLICNSSFHSFKNTLYRVKLSQLVEFTGFSFHGSWFDCSYLKTYCQTQVTSIFFYTFFWKFYTIMFYTEVSGPFWIHFGINVRYIKVHFFFACDGQLFQHHLLERLSFSIKLSLHPLGRSTSGLCTLFHWFICLYFG